MSTVTTMNHEPAYAGSLDIKAIRARFAFPGSGRIVTNNAASTQPPRDLLELYRLLAPRYENVHRGQSSASQAMTARFGTARPIERSVVENAMSRVSSWNRQLTQRALDGLGAIPGITIYGPPDAARRTSLVAFNLAGRDPVSVAEDLDRAGVEARAGCHCATLAHHALRLDPPASCRLSFYLYNTVSDVDQAVPETRSRPIWPAGRSQV